MRLLIANLWGESLPLKEPHMAGRTVNNGLPSWRQEQISKVMEMGMVMIE
jgi:hypothetical protein